MSAGDHLNIALEQSDSAAIADGFAVIRLTGRLTNDAAVEFDRCWERLIANGIKAVAVDMSGLTFVSSAGLRSMLRFCKEMAPPRGGMSMFGMAQSLATVFRYSGFEKLIPHAADLAGAKRRLRLGGAGGGSIGDISL